MNNFLCFDNTLKKISAIGLNSRKIEASLKKHRLSFPQDRDQEIENHRFDPFVKTFYDLILKTRWIPFQSEFVSEYIDSHKDSLSRFLPQKEAAMKARLMRAFPSYVRDAHFAMKLYESKLFDDVIYNVTMDIETGLDLLVIKDSKIYGIHLFVETPLANQWRSKKNNRHEENPYIIDIDFTVSKSDGEPCGRYFLFGQKQVEELARIINQASMANNLDIAAS